MRLPAWQGAWCHDLRPAGARGSVSPRSPRTPAAVMTHYRLHAPVLKCVGHRAAPFASQLSAARASTKLGRSLSGSQMCLRLIRSPHSPPGTSFAPGALGTRGRGPCRGHRARLSGGASAVCHWLPISSTPRVSQRCPQCPKKIACDKFEVSGVTGSEPPPGARVRFRGACRRTGGGRAPRAWARVSPARPPAPCLQRWGRDRAGSAPSDLFAGSG